SWPRSANLDAYCASIFVQHANSRPAFILIHRYGIRRVSPRSRRLVAHKPYKIWLGFAGRRRSAGGSIIDGHKGASPSLAGIDGVRRPGRNRRRPAHPGRARRVYPERYSWERLYSPGSRNLWRLATTRHTRRGTVVYIGPGHPGTRPGAGHSLALSIFNYGAI